MREPLVWPGGTRHSASGLLVQIHTDEGLVGIGEAPGRRCRRSDDHRRRAGPVPRRPGSPARRVAGAPDGGVHAQLEPDRRVRDRRCRDGAARPQGQGARRAGRRAARRLLPGPRPVVGYLFIDTPEANAQKAGAFVDAGYTELKLKVGRDFEQDHDTIAAIRDRVGPDVKIRIDANMIWSVPAAIKWIRAWSASTSSTSSSRCRTSTCRAWRRCAAPSPSRSPRTRRAPTCARCSS